MYNLTARLVEAETKKRMEIISKIKFSGRVTHVNYDRNGAHIRLKLAKKEDILHDISVETDHESYINIPYWEGRDFDLEIAGSIRSLAKNDIVCIVVTRVGGWFHTHTRYSIINYSIESCIECLDSCYSLR